MSEFTSANTSVSTLATLATSAQEATTSTETPIQTATSTVTNSDAIKDGVVPNIELIGSGQHLTPEDCLNTLHHSEATANIRGYFGCYLNENCRFLGTDASENWSIKQFLEYSKEAFKMTSAWEYTLIPGTRLCFEMVTNQVVNFDELLLAKSFKCTARGSGTMIKKDNYWFITQYHLTFPTPNDLAYEICRHIEVYEKKILKSKLANIMADTAAESLLKELELEDKLAKGNQNNNKSKGNNKNKKK